MPTSTPSTADTEFLGGTRPDRPLDDPLPYGTGAAAWGAGPATSGPSPARPETSTVDAAPRWDGWTTDTATFDTSYPPVYVDPTASREVATRERRRTSPVLGVAGAGTMAIAVWALVGAPVVTAGVWFWAGVALLTLVGVLLVVRR